MAKTEMNCKPIKGTRDFLPQQMRIRKELLDNIFDIYSSFGFSQIETPIIEDIENLTLNAGGENEKLIFNIAKRGEKLEKALENIINQEKNIPQTTQISDLGLRYDLTLPLVRYYANNKENLPRPFKSLQFGYAFRAERPQKMRYRQFMQCDIDIIGEKRINAEFEILYASYKFLSKLPLTNLTLKINDRRIVQLLMSWCGFKKSDYNRLMILLDKIDKIGMDNIANEMSNMGIDSNTIERYQDFIEGFLSSATNEDRFRYLLDNIDDTDNDNGLKDIIQQLQNLIDTLEKITDGFCSIIFDINLIRGMNYYSGCIYEYICDESGTTSIAGGGRYDNFIEKFVKESIPAVGISIGFERIFQLLLDKAYINTNQEKIAILYDKNISLPDFAIIEKCCEYIREKIPNSIVSLFPKAKNYKFQIKTLKEQGYNIEEVTIPRKKA